MGSKNEGKKKSNEMEERDATPEEITQIAGAVGIPSSHADPIPAYRGDREDDEPDREGPPPHVIQAQKAVEQAAAVSNDSLNERMLKALEAMEARAGETQGSGSELMALAMMQLAEGIKSMRQGQIDAANIIAGMQRTTMAPENKFFPDISAFNLRGEKDFKRPALRCEYFLPWPVKPSAAEELTREEVELLNLLTPGEHTVMRADRTRVKIQCRVITKLDSDEPSRVVLNHDTAFNNDYHRLMPFDWIRQMVENNPKTRAAGKAVLTMEEEEMLIAARQFNDGRTAEANEHVVSVGA